MAISTRDSIASRLGMITELSVRLYKKLNYEMILREIRKNKKGHTKKYKNLS